MDIRDEHHGGETMSGLGSSLWKCYDSSKVAMSMVLVQMFATGMMILSRVILNDGTFVYAVLTYRHVVATVCVAPLALFLEREQKKQHKLTLKIWVWLFINGLLGIAGAMGLLYYGLAYTTATYAMNFLNMISIVTFVISVILGMESLGLNRWAGRVKVLGSCLCVGGALTTSLYDGKEFYIRHVGTHHATGVAHGIKNLTKGSILLSGSCICYALWFIVQAKVINLFPLKYWVTMLTCIMGILQSIVIGFCMNRRKSAWKLGFNLPLLTIVYSGALSTAATFCLISFAVKKRGPTFPTMFTPLTLIFVSVLEAFFLGEPIKLGTVIGMVLIIAGLYSYLWGKQKQSTKKMATENQPPNSAVDEVAIIDLATASTVVTMVSNANVDGEENSRR